MAVIKTKFNLEDYVRTTDNFKFTGKIVGISYSGSGTSYKVTDKSGQTLTFPAHELELADEEILDSNEKRYLEGVIRPFKDRVECIAKWPSYISEGAFHFSIYLKNPGETAVLPTITNKSIYSSLATGRSYTLEELGLFEEPEKCKRIFDF